MLGKRLFSLLLFSQLNFLIFAQINRTRSWVFGESIGLHFNKSGTIDTLSGIYKPGYPQYEGTAVYNDSSGNLLYYVLNGQLIGNDNKPINTGFAMGGGSSASQANIITSLNDSIFHVFGSSSGFNYYYCCFDRYANKFTVLGKSLIYRASEAQAVVNHQNGKWKWVVCHSRLGDTLYSFLINENGLETCPVISHAGPFYKDWYPGQGCMKFSSDGRYLAIASLDEDKVTFCSFNNQTGEIRHLFIVQVIGFPYGIEFSRDNKAFVSTLRPCKIWELNLEKMDSISVMQSKRKVYDTTADDFLYQLQSAPDGNIYVAVYLSPLLGKLSLSNKVWSFSFTNNLFGPRMSYAGFPSFNASHFHTPALNFSYSQNCKTNRFRFTATDTFKASSWQWKYSKGAANYAGSGITSEFSFPDTGVWQVQCIASKGSRKDTVTKNIEILKPLKHNYLGEDILLPAGSAMSGTIEGPANMHCLHWHIKGDTIEHKTKDYLFSDTGYYICRATNPVFCTYYDTIRVRVCDSFARAAVIERRGDSLFTKTYATKYQWYRVTTNGDSLIVGATFNRIKLFSPGTYKLRTWNANGCDSVSSAFEVNTLGLKKLKLADILILPNPNHGNFTIQTKQKTIKEIAIYSMTGKLVYLNINLNTRNVQINKQLKTGIYLIVLNDTDIVKMIVD